MLAIGAELEGRRSREGHLYLTDYRALYVGHVVDIAREDVRERDREQVPDYYAEQPSRVRLLVQADGRPPARRRRHARRDRRLQLLRNLGYNELPVSLYGGMVDLPLIVDRPDGMRFFEPDVRAS